MDTISYDDFGKVDIRVGHIVEVLPFERARVPSYKLKIDFGPEIGLKQSSAQAATDYTIEQLTGRRCLAVVNFEPRNIAGFLSEVLVLGVTKANGGLSLISPDGDAEVGSRLY